MKADPNVTTIQHEYRSDELDGGLKNGRSGSDMSPEEASVEENQQMIIPEVTLHDTAFSDPAFYLKASHPPGTAEEDR